MEIVGDTEPPPGLCLGFGGSAGLLQLLGSKPVRCAVRFQGCVSLHGMANAPSSDSIEDDLQIPQLQPYAYLLLFAETLLIRDIFTNTD